MPVAPRNEDGSPRAVGPTGDGSQDSPVEHGSGNTGPTHGRRRRKARQRRNELYGRIREDMQLDGTLPTVPEGAMRSEVVDPRLQGCQQLPQIIQQALKENWNVPDVAKPGIIGKLLEPFFAQDIVLDRDGNQVVVPPDRRLLIELARILNTMEQRQWERDNPELAGKAKGGSASISVQTNIAAAALIREALAAGHAGSQAMQAVQATTVQTPTVGRPVPEVLAMQHDLPITPMQRSLDNEKTPTER